MSKVSAFSSLLLSTALSCAVFFGCDAADRAIDCTKICNRYSECFDENYDKTACIDSCEDNAENSENFDDKADACESCIDDKSCTGSFSCVDECAGIVP